VNAIQNDSPIIPHDRMVVSDVPEAALALLERRSRREDDAAMRQVLLALAQAGSLLALSSAEGRSIVDSSAAFVDIAGIAAEGSYSDIVVNADADVGSADGCKSQPTVDSIVAVVHSIAVVELELAD